MKSQRSLEELKQIVVLFGRTIEANGKKTSAVILANAAAAIAEYESAKLRSQKP